MRHLYWWRVVAEHGYVRHAEKRAGNGIDFGCAGAGDGGGYRHGRDQVYQRGAAVGRTGVDGAQEFVNTSAQAWDSTLIFLAGLMLLCLQISCGFAVMRGRNWGAGAMWSASASWCFTCCWPPSAAFSRGVYRGRGNQRPNPARSDPAKDPRRGDPGVAVRPYRQPPLLRRAQVRF